MAGLSMDIKLETRLCEVNGDAIDEKRKICIAGCGS